jgi:hypothetical protein
MIVKGVLFMILKEAAMGRVKTLPYHLSRNIKKETINIIQDKPSPIS